MSGHVSQLSSFAQDRAAHWTVVIVMAALAGLSYVTQRKHRLLR